MTWIILNGIDRVESCLGWPELAGESGVDVLGRARRPTGEHQAAVNGPAPSQQDSPLYRFV